VDIKERNKQVKSILAQEFGQKNVSVKNGTGTAWGWCNIGIKTPDPCPNKQNSNTCRFYCTDGICKGTNRPFGVGGIGLTTRQLTLMDINDRVEKLLTDTAFFKFYSNDGYNTPTDKVIINVDFI